MLKHTSRVLSQPSHLSQSYLARTPPILQDDGTTLFYIDKIPKYRKRGSRYQLVASNTGAPLHEAEWQPTRDFLDDDGTITKALHEYLIYLIEHNLFPHLHNIVVDNKGGRRH